MDFKGCAWDEDLGLWYEETRESEFSPHSLWLISAESHHGRDYNASRAT